jgi:CheY-like chemotaxis protein
MYRRLSVPLSSQIARTAAPPKRRATPCVSDVPPEVAGADTDASRTVMLVSPDDVFCAAAACALMDAGFTVLVAANSMSAIAALADRSVDGLITTIRMPRGHPNGLALARLVRDQNSMSTVIFLTDEMRFTAAERTLLSGKSAIVCPVGDVPELIQRTRRGLGGGPDTPAREPAELG